MLAISKFNFDFFLNKKLYFIFYIILLRFIPITADASYFIVAGYALLGRQQIIESLFLMWLFSMLNAEIIPHTGNESVIRYIVVLTCFLSILIRANFKKIDIFAFTYGSLKDINKKSMDISLKNYDLVFSGIRGNNIDNNKILFRDEINSNYSNKMCLSFLSGNSDFIYKNSRRKLLKMCNKII